MLFQAFISYQLALTKVLTSALTNQMWFYAISLPLGSPDIKTTYSRNLMKMNIKNS
jgi:hypothetical protein